MLENSPHISEALPDSSLASSSGSSAEPPSQASPQQSSEPESAPAPKPTVATLRASILAMLQQAQADCKGDQWEKVIAACESAIAQSQQCKQINTERSAKLSAGNTPTATDEARAKAMLTTADTFAQKGDAPEAVRAYLQAIQLHPQLYAAYNRLRYNLMRYDVPEGDPMLQEIVDVCQQMIDRFPEMRVAQVTLAYGLTKLGKTQAAIERYQEASDAIWQKNEGNRTGGPSSGKSETGESMTRRPVDFIVIGAEKCGTTSLFQYLAGHPEVVSPVEKEIDFFDQEYKQGVDWYLAHFPALPTEKKADTPRHVVGETSANYLYNTLAPERVFKHFPSAQLVVLLRHPVDRTISRYNMMVRNGNEKRSLEAAIAEDIRQIQQAATPEGIPWRVLSRCRHVGNSLYFYHLQRWLSHFPREQLLVLQSETLFAQPEATLGKLCRTLGIGAPPEQAYTKHNAGDYSEASTAVREQLAEFYQPHVRKLETLLSQTFEWTLKS